MVNIKGSPRGAKGVAALVVILLVSAFGMLHSLPAIAEEGGAVGQEQVSKSEGSSTSEAKENEQEDGRTVNRDGEGTKKDGKDEHADSLDGDKENANSPPAGFGETVIRFFQSLFFGNGVRAESADSIEFSGQIQWDDFNDLYGNRPESVDIHVSIIDKEGQNFGYGGGLHTDASEDWKFSGSVPRSLVQDDEVYVGVFLDGYDTHSVKVSTSGETIYTCSLITFHPHIQVRWNRPDLYPVNPNTEIPFTIYQQGKQDLLSYTGSITGTDCEVSTENPYMTFWNVDLNDITWPLYIDGVHAGLSYKFSPGEGVGYEVANPFTEGDSVTSRPPTLGFRATAYRPIKVQVVWEDNDNANGNRPESGYIQIYADGEPAGMLKYLDSSAEWRYEEVFATNSENGSPVNYTTSGFLVYGDNWKLVSPPKYEQETTGSMDDGFVITLRDVADETVNIPVTKAWDDHDDLYENRPGNITYHLYASVLNDRGNSESEPVLVGTKVGYPADDYAVTFEGMPVKDENNNTLTYHVGEEPVVGYKENAGYRYYDYLGEYMPRNVFDGTNPVVLTNAADMRQIYVQKLWDDAGHEDKRPYSVEFTLAANGEDIETISLTSSDSYMSAPEYDGRLWVKKFSIDYPMAYQGQTITYSVAESPNANYDVDVAEGDLVFGVGSDACRSFVVTNTYDSPTVSIPIIKNWDDNGNELNNRPESVTYRLYAATNVDGNNTCPTEPVLVGTQTSSAEDGYAATFKGMPLTDEDGNTITYIVGEDTVVGYEPVEGYLKIGDSYQLRHNCVFDGTSPVAITNATEHGQGDGFEVMKIWDDMDDTAGRPQSATFRLWADGTEVSTLTLTQENVSSQNYSDWRTRRINMKASRPDLYEGCLENLPEEAELWSGHFMNGSSPFFPVARNGVAISYEITEDSNPSYESVNGGFYRATYHKGYVRVVEFVNTRKDVTPGLRRAIKVHKVWNDEGYEGERPESVTIRIYADGKEVDTAELNEDNGWAYECVGVPERLDGEWIDYEVVEDYVEGYETSVECKPETQGSYPTYVFTVSNTRIAEDPTTSISVHKNWDDDGNAQGKRPEHITVRLCANGEPINSAELNEETGWSFEFSKMPLLGEDGEKIAYTLVEDKVEGYESSISSEEAGEGSDLSFRLTNTIVKEVVANKPVEDKPADDKVILKKIADLVPTGGESIIGVVACVVLLSAVGALVARARTKR